ncbi:type II secretion system F family protein [Laribacter hongkongensis]|uniref:Bacterial type II secretion system protein n=1 Tax=Laribacter hongkongensis TaxID=168471 RepID=A0A248LGX0_9NEIS|nr:type II secretion system F family protein [Laribacter hongkongensis]ASJ23997.1 bacterial type II secretion system protein [Laribacter hongkongensis]MCG9041008.1 type II secretion system F family protein [Laribacter hongkongensis]MCG9066467.1 type II secretion system F family protein [Laribacter hongkongensis]MCG9088799.1 type II secretion system F family protein [Laribacter hongkongensis]MCG9108786.1 type II secretion system F family protein [Laribacter hongkongensis]
MQFSYRAARADGRIVRGVMVAANDLDLDQRLTRLGLVTLDARPQRAGLLDWLRRKTLPRQERIHFCFYLDQTLRAGVPLLEGLADLRDSASSPLFREILAMLVLDIEGGKRLSEALAEHPSVFDSVFVNLVATGETTGALPDVLARLADQLKWQDELIAQTRKILLYPAFVGTMLLLVIIFLMTYLVPQLVDFIRDIQKELPLQTRILLAVSDVFVHFGWLMPLVPLTLVAAYQALRRRSAAAALLFDSWKLRLKPVGPVYQKVILARFAATFALMYSAGVPVLTALQVCEQGAGNLRVAQALADSRRRITEGQGITDSMAASELFPPLVLRMLKIGEQTGALDTALANVGYFYDRDVKESIDRLQALIEPMLTVALGLLLALVMSAVLGPIYDMISNLSR